MSQTIIRTAQTVRSLLLQQVEAIPEELFDSQPEGFSNTIRWNTGHTLVTLDFFLAMAIPFNSKLPEHYAGLFASGTKPSDWKVSPPAKEELVQYMSAQLNRIAEVDPHLLDAPLPEPIVFGPLRFETAGELFNFTFVHETMHLAIIGCLLKCIQPKQ